MKVILKTGNAAGSLESVLRLFTDNKINLARIESLPSRTSEDEVTFFVDFDAKCDPAEVRRVLTAAEASRVCRVAQWLTVDADSSTDFPRKVNDLDLFTHKTLDCGEELSADHPGFTDAEYRARREAIVANARNYIHGTPIPRVEYTQAERDTWTVVYDKLAALRESHACEQFRRILPLLEANCGYSRDNIPQLEDISTFLKACTGFTLRPVAGLLSPRDFLNGLAFRVFHSTQYIRHHSKPLYTPEPDVVHELIGHVPLFADPDFAAFSQEIGLASLGVSDEDIEKLATCYWFTVEFGLCLENGKPKAFGAGLLSSFGELEYCLSDKPEVRPFNPEETAVQKYPITEYQPVYYLAESFADAKKKMREFSRTLSRPFGVRYNPFSQAIDIIANRADVTQMIEEIQRQTADVLDSLHRIPKL